MLFRSGHDGSGDADDPVIAEVTRDGFVESTHRGRVVALDAAGEVALAVGRVDLPVLLRSCAKPLQAVGMVRSGLDLDAPHLAIAAASHDGTAMHTQLVREVLATAGLDETVLDNTPALPLNRRAAAEQLVARGPDRLGQNCSGKHAAMLATCVANGWPLDSYLDHEHPLQQALMETLEDLAGEPVAHVATDGCGAPIGAVSLTGLARSFARLAAADPASPEGRVAAAIRAHPVIVGGEERDVTRLLRAVPGLVSKDGAEGCDTAALADGRAVALKIADGAQRARPPVMVAALRWLGVGSGDLDALAEVPILGHGRPVGAVRARLEQRRP
ncbi:MAG: asparaginase [Acidimicrobiales bacterium]